jgi:16S rRNA processing protein RimM
VPDAHDPRVRLLEVGRIDRPHGVRGAVLVRLLTNNLERVAPGAVLDADGRPLTIVSAGAHGDRWLVTFAEVAGREAAEAVAGVVLRAPAVEGDAAGYWVHDLIGATVLDTTGGDHGVVVEVLENPASDVLVLSSGPLVPLRFVTWDDDGRLVVDGPAGLLEA